MSDLRERVEAQRKKWAELEGQYILRGEVLKAMDALLAAEEGPGLAILQGVGHIEGYTECPHCKACWRTGEREVHWWDCKALAARPVDKDEKK